MAILTIGLLALVVIVLPRMLFVEVVAASAIVLADFVGLFFLARETWNRKMTIEHGFIDDET